MRKNARKSIGFRYSNSGQMVSAVLGARPLRAATWWTSPEIPSTSASTPVGCWDSTLGKAGAVQIATSGKWEGTKLGLKGGLSGGSDFNHAKFGVSTSGTGYESIFGDMNQQGTLSGSNCGSSQNGRGGLFYVLKDQNLHDSIAKLISGSSASIADQ